MALKESLCAYSLPKKNDGGGHANVKKKREERKVTFVGFLRAPDVEGVNYDNERKKEIY